MPPLAFTQAKYAFAMFPISVNDVPGWLVSIPPSAIGVPVAGTPGLVPHCDVLTVALAGPEALPCEPGAVVAAELLPALLLHPARASIAIAALTATVARTPGTCVYIQLQFRTCPHLLWW